MGELLGEIRGEDAGRVRVAVATVFIAILLGWGSIADLER
jgi:hypothetical protein